MTEAQLRAAVVTAAQTWLGCNERDGSHRKIIDIYNAHKPLVRGYKVKYTDAWCATFVSAVFIESGLTDIAPTECSCSRMIQLYKNIGRWQEADSFIPSPGDLMMYDWNDTGKGENTGAPEHVGMVVSVSGSTIRVIEGNYDNAVKARTMKVDGRYIRGYCLPNYASKATVAVPVKPAEPVKENRIGKPDPAKSGPYKPYAKTWTVTATTLNMRLGAATTKGIVKTLKKGDVVTCYGYYTQNGATIWLYVKDKTGVIGYCSKKYLK